MIDFSIVKPFLSRAEFECLIVQEAQMMNAESIDEANQLHHQIMDLLKLTARRQKMMKKKIIRPVRIVRVNSKDIFATTVINKGRFGPN